MAWYDSIQEGARKLRRSFRLQNPRRGGLTQEPNPDMIPRDATGVQVPPGPPAYLGGGRTPAQPESAPVPAIQPAPAAAQPTSPAATGSVAPQQPGFWQKAVAAVSPLADLGVMGAVKRLAGVAGAAAGRYERGGILGPEGVIPGLVQDVKPAVQRALYGPQGTPAAAPAPAISPSGYGTGEFVGPLQPTAEEQPREIPRHLTPAQDDAIQAVLRNKPQPGIAPQKTTGQWGVDTWGMPAEQRNAIAANQQFMAGPGSIESKQRQIAGAQAQQAAVAQNKAAQAGLQAERENKLDIARQPVLAAQATGAAGIAREGVAQAGENHRAAAAHVADLQGKGITAGPEYAKAQVELYKAQGELVKGITVEELAEGAKLAALPPDKIKAEDRPKLERYKIWQDFNAKAQGQPPMVGGPGISAPGAAAASPAAVPTSPKAGEIRIDPSTKQKYKWSGTGDPNDEKTWQKV